MHLVLVESPTKARTIKQFLSKDYQVMATYGHMRDLPRSRLGIDIENNFEPHYIVPIKARPRFKELKEEVKKADKCILASDEDREGEAIAWHLTQALGLNQQPIPSSQLSENKKSKLKTKNYKLKTVERIVFHEITKTAIEAALAHPRDIKTNLVDAQQARRILDRLVGYKLSPFLWKKVKNRLSAGRVQSVALRLICERENEIRKFKPDEYWTIVASLLKIKSQKSKIKSFEAELYKINDEVIPKLGIKDQAEAEKIKTDLEKCDFQITKVSKKEVKKNPLPPFTTSTLQQEASKRSRFSVKQTMRLAQNLYEQGLITYMRTDSVNLSQESVIAAKNWIEANLGAVYAKDAPRFFKTKSRLAQEAHEAIRPTKPELTFEKLATSPKFKLEKNDLKLYDLIWRRFIASQLPQAIFDSTSVEVTTNPNPKPQTPKIYQLKTNGSMMKFDGFLKIWPMQFEERELPPLTEGEDLKLIEVKPEQHFTQPPPRYNEASLVKTLEQYGIGRPSTYAPIISVVQDRYYVIKDEQRRFKPTEIGELVNKILVEHFPQIVDIQFTAKLEEDLDKIAAGQKQWQKVLKVFYDPFAANLEQKYEQVEKIDLGEQETGEACEKCGKPMILKYGRFGKFIACSGFPDCRNTKTIGVTNETGEKLKCPKCKTGDVIRRKTKRGRFFYGCSRYPDCDNASWNLPTITDSTDTDITDNADTVAKISV